MSRQITGLFEERPARTQGTFLGFNRVDCNGVKASGTIGGIPLTAINSGTAGNSITLALVDPVGNNAALGVVVTSSAIVVNLATGAGGAITSTLADIVTILNATAAVTALVTVGTPAAPATVATAVTQTALTGGTATKTIGSVPLVKGMARVYQLRGYIRTNLHHGYYEAVGTFTLVSTTAAVVGAVSATVTNESDSSLLANLVVNDTNDNVDVVITPGACATATFDGEVELLREFAYA